MKDIDLLEYGSPFALRVDGELIQLADPATLHFQTVLTALAAKLAPGTPNVSVRKRQIIFERWCAAYDLPVFQDAQRLAYLVDHYRSAIVYDLRTYAQADLGDLWRRRRWRTLLDLLDHLPSHSWFQATVSMDPEHAKMVAKAIASRKDSGEPENKGPHLTAWTPETAMLAKVIDAIKGVSYTVAAVQGAKPSMPDPEPRPKTPIELEMKREEYARKKAAHEALVARLLPHKKAN